MALTALLPIRVQGSKIHAWVNAKATDAGTYRIRYNRALGGLFLPRGRGDNLHSLGGGGSWNESGYRKKFTLRDAGGTAYQVVEGFDSGGVTSLGLFTSAVIDGGSSDWSAVSGNPMIAPTDIAGSGIREVTSPFGLHDGSQWVLFCAAQYTTGGKHNIHRFTNASMGTSGWSHYSGGGDDGAIIDPSGVPGRWDMTGVADPMVFQLPGDADDFLRMFYSGYQTGYAWAVGYAESDDFGLTWTTWWGNPIIQAPPAQSAWSSVSGRVVTVADGSVFDPDAVVVIRNDATTIDDYGLSRIQSISGNDLTLYHAIAGMTGSDSGRLVAQLNSGSITPHAITSLPGGGYRLYLTTFQPFRLSGGDIGNCELCYSVDFDSIAALKQRQYRWNHLLAPHSIPSIFDADRNNENINFFAVEDQTATPDVMADTTVMVEPTAVFTQTGTAAALAETAVMAEPSAEFAQTGTPDVMADTAVMAAPTAVFEGAPIADVMSDTTVIAEPTAEFVQTGVPDVMAANAVIPAHTALYPPTSTGTWRDTQANNSMVEDASIFEVRVIAGYLALHSARQLANAHSHYMDEEFDAGGGGFEFTCRVMLNTDPDDPTPASGGITILSQYDTVGVGTDSYYRIRANGAFSPTWSYVLNDHGTPDAAQWTGTLDSGVIPEPGAWYLFRVQVEDTGSATEIRCRIWRDGDAEPSGWQIDMSDPSAGRLTSGKIGVWISDTGGGDRAWAGFAVDGTPIPLEQAFELSLASTQSLLLYDPTPETGELTLTAVFPNSGTSDVTTGGDFNVSHPAFLTVDNSSSPAIATAVDGGGQQTVTVTADYLGVTSNPVQILVKSSVATGQFLDEVTCPWSGITHTFDRPYRCLQNMLGYWFVYLEDQAGAVSHVQVTGKTPAFASGRNGSMKNPPSDLDYYQAYDSRGEGYQAGAQVTFPANFVGWDSLVSARSRNGENPDLIGQNPSASNALLTDITAISFVPFGTTLTDTTFRPRINAAAAHPIAKTLWDAADIDFSRLPNASYQGGGFFYSGGDANPYKRYTRVMERMHTFHVQDFVGRKFHAIRQQPNYWESCGDVYGDVCTLAWTDPASLGATEQDRRDLLIATVQAGLDCYYAGQLIDGVETFSADSSYYPGLVHLAGFLLNDAGMKSPTYRHRRPNQQVVYSDSFTPAVASTMTGSTVITTTLGASPSANAQAIIGSSPHNGTVSSPPAGGSGGQNCYHWWGASALSNRRPGRLVIWRQQVTTSSSIDHLNPKEWARTLIASGKHGWSLMSYLMSNVHIYVAEILMQKVLFQGGPEGAAETLWPEDGPWDMVENWMDKWPADRVANMAFVEAARQAAGLGSSLAGEKQPGNAGSGFATNMYFAYYYSLPPLGESVPTADVMSTTSSIPAPTAVYTQTGAPSALTAEAVIPEPIGLQAGDDAIANVMASEAVIAEPTAIFRQIALADVLTEEAVFPAQIGVQSGLPVNDVMASSAVIVEPTAVYSQTAVAAVMAALASIPSHVALEFGGGEERPIAGILRRGFLVLARYMGEDVAYYPGGDLDALPLSIRAIIRRQPVDEIRPNTVASGRFEVWISNSTDGYTTPAHGDFIRFSPRIGGALQNLRITTVFDDSDEGAWHLGGRF